MRLLNVGLLVAAVSTTQSLNAASAPGSLDLMFLPPPDHAGTVFAVAEDASGRILMGGYFGLFRLEDSGAQDLTFEPPLGAEGDMPTVNAIAIQVDGKILVGGQFEADGVQNLARLHPDGTLDYGFADGAYPDHPVESIVVEPDGKILIGGRFEQYGSVPILHLARLTPDGRLDPDFKQSVPDQFVFGIICEADGKIFIRGNLNFVGGQPHRGVARLNSDGSLDTNWNCPFNVPFCSAFALQPDGKLLISGSFSFALEPPTFHLVRLNRDGSLDTSYNTHIPPAAIQALAVQPDGRVIGAGNFTGIISPTSKGVARFNPDGILDTTFNPGLGIDGSNDSEWSGPAIYSMLLDRNGKVVVGGNFTSFDGVPRADIARLHGDTGLPASFVTRQLPFEPPRIVRLFAAPAATTKVYAIEEVAPPGLSVSEISHEGVFDRQTGKIKFGPFLDSQPRTLTYQIIIPPGGVFGLLGIYHFTGSASADGVSTAIAGDQDMVIAGLFPADINPPDNRLSMDEITAYAAEWRRGGSWPHEPSPITIDYVTRAAFLWRSGEIYSVDSRVVPEPLWWIPRPMARLLDAAERESSLSRALPPAYIPGQEISILLNLAPTPSVLAAAVEEVLPTGWTFISATEAGTFDARSHTIRWGPFFGKMPAVLSYTAKPADDVGGTVSFSGAASFDGVSIRAVFSSLREGCKIAASLENERGLLLSISGRRGQKYVIESSSDLKTWTQIASLTNCPWPMEFRDATAHDTRRFYRAVPLP